MTVPESGSEIRGLVSAFGSAGCSSGQSGDWRLAFYLAAWSYGGAVEEGNLRCEMPVDKGALESLMSSVKPYAMVEARVKEITARGALVLSDLRVASAEDPVFSPIRDRLQAPVTVETPLLGVLELDRRLNAYNGTAAWCGAPVRISLSCNDTADPSAAIAAAESLFQSQAEWSTRVDEFAADRLLDLKNDNWTEPDERRLTREEFISQMTLRTISIDESGAFSFWHDDGDLFCGHSIQISGDLDEGLKDADIPG